MWNQNRADTTRGRRFNEACPKATDRGSAPSPAWAGVHGKVMMVLKSCPWQSGKLRLTGTRLFEFDHVFVIAGLSRNGDAADGQRALVPGSGPSAPRPLAPGPWPLAPGSCPWLRAPGPGPGPGPWPLAPGNWPLATCDGQFAGAPGRFLSWRSSGCEPRAVHCGRGRAWARRGFRSCHRSTRSSQLAARRTTVRLQVSGSRVLNPTWVAARVAGHVADLKLERD